MKSLYWYDPGFWKPAHAWLLGVIEARYYFGTYCGFYSAQNSNGRRLALALRRAFWL